MSRRGMLLFLLLLSIPAVLVGAQIGVDRGQWVLGAIQKVRKRFMNTV